jgi:hypothetical protein
MKRMLVAAALAFACVGEASAWNARGHMMVATIAWDRLKAGTRAKVSALIRLNPHYATWTEGVSPLDRDLVAFVKAATWADEIKGEAGYSNGPQDPSSPSVGYADMNRHSEWHYRDLSFSPDGTAFPAAPESNAITEIVRMSAELGSGSATHEVKSYDLVWLLHVVGDVHQPLHATSRYTTALPQGDRGGNEVRVCPTSCDVRPVALHAFWDNLEGNGGEPQDAINRARKLGPAPAGATAQLAPDVWLEESLALAKSAAYASPVGLEAGPYVLTEAYKQQAGAVAEAQIAIAGVRLAKVIEDAVGQ